MAKVYLVQMDILWCNKTANFETVRRLLQSKTIEKGGLIVLPEMFATGFVGRPKEGIEESFEHAESGITASFLSTLSQETGCLVQGSGIRKQNGQFRNHVSVYGPDSQTEITSYDKIYPFHTEQKHFEAGEAIKTYKFDLFNVAPFICYDLRFPEVFRAAMNYNIELFTVVASWPTSRESQWATLLKARAIENQCYVLGVNRIGEDPYTEYNGGSIIVGPTGDIIDSLGSEEGILSAEIDYAILREKRQNFPVLKDAKPFFSFPIKKGVI